MKNLWKTLFVAALFVSCSEANVDEQPVPETTQGTPIQFELVNEGGRAAFFQGEGHRVDWEGGEKIAIRRWLGTAESPAYDANTRQRGNYTVDVNGALTLSQYDEVTYSDDAEKGTFITACYPDNTNANANKIGNLTLSAAQTQAAGNDHSHIDDYMIMMTPSPLYFEPGVAPEKVSLRLQSVLSIVEVTLKGDAEKKVASLELVTISDSPLAYSKGVLDLTQDITAEDAACPITVETGLSSVSLSLNTPAALSAEGTKFYFVVLPGAHAANDITLKVMMEDGSCAEVAMDAIEFKMNKVYRPEISLTTFATMNPAEIEILNTDATQPFWGSVNYENGAAIITSRMGTNGNNSRTMVLSNVPATFMYSEEATWQTLAMNNTSCPDVTVKAATSGYLYITTTGAGSTWPPAMVADGWVVETLLEDAGIIYIDEKGTSGSFAIYSKYVEAGTTLELSSLRNLKPSESLMFQGFRPVAKKITWPLAKMSVTAATGASMTTFNIGNSITLNATATIAQANQSGTTKSVPYGYRGMNLYAVDGTATSTTVSATATTAGMVYAICPSSLYTTANSASDKGNVTGWKQIESFYCSESDELYYIVAKYVAVDDVIILSYGTEATAVTDRSNIGTGILLGDLSIAQ